MAETQGTIWISPGKAIGALEAMEVSPEHVEATMQAQIDSMRAQVKGTRAETASLIKPVRAAIKHLSTLVEQYSVTLPNEASNVGTIPIHLFHSRTHLICKPRVPSRLSYHTNGEGATQHPEHEVCLPISYYIRMLLIGQPRLQGFCRILPKSKSSLLSTNALQNLMDWILSKPGEEMDMTLDQR